MRIAVSAKGEQLTSKVDENFGKAFCFLIVNPETLEFEVLKNDVDKKGAGIKLAKSIIDYGTNFLITGNIGPNAFRVLKEGNINVSVNAAGRVIDVIQQYKNGLFSKAAKPNSKGKLNNQECLTT